MEEKQGLPPIQVQDEICHFLDHIYNFCCNTHEDYTEILSTTMSCQLVLCKKIN